MSGFDDIPQLLRCGCYDEAIQLFHDCIFELPATIDILYETIRSNTIVANCNRDRPHIRQKIIDAIGCMLNALVSPQSRYNKKDICFNLIEYFLDNDLPPNNRLEILFIRTLIEANLTLKDLSTLSEQEYRLDSNNIRFLIAWFNLTNYPIFPFIIALSVRCFQEYDNSELLLTTLQKALREKRLRFSQFDYDYQKIIQSILQRSEDSLIHLYVTDIPPEIFDFDGFNHKLTKRYWHHQYLLYTLGLIGTGMSQYLIMWIISDWLIDCKWIPLYKAFRIVESIHAKRHLKFQSE